MENNTDPRFNPRFLFSPDRRSLLLCGWADHVRLLRVPDPDAAVTAGEVLKSMPEPAAAIPAVKSSRGWKASVDPSDDLKVTIRAGLTSKTLMLPSKVRQMSSSPRGDLLLVVTEGGRASLWNPRFGIETVVLTEQGCLAACFNRSSGRLEVLRKESLRLTVPHAPSPSGFVERWELLDFDVGRL